MNRRVFLALTALAGLAAAGCGPGGGNSGSMTFANRLRIPPLLEPGAGPDGTKVFDLALQAGRTEFLADKPATTWGVNGSYLGPTLRMRRGDKVAMAVRNQLPEATTLHWHGMRLPAAMDGGPHQMIAPGDTWRPYWTVDQPAATSWYHPHPHGNTALHVYRGLAGMIQVDDGATGLPGRYGVDDIPIILQDKRIEGDGQLSEHFPGVFGLLGDQILVNGTYDPFLEVTTDKVRLRILNASNARKYNVGFGDRRQFTVVATDGGLLPRPVRTDEVWLTPGERVELVADFRPGESVLLRSFEGSDDIDDGEFDLLKIVASQRLEQLPGIPGRLPARPPIETVAGAQVREFTLSGTAKINGREMDLTRIDEVIPAGTREIWEVKNVVFAHNLHIHDAAFRVLDVDGDQPPEWMRGPKDTVFVPGDTTVRLAVEFGTHTDPKTPYMFHCHILRHEDQGMMGQFVIVPPGTENSVSRTISLAGPEHHH
jgi:FtsP/CotA-like multicopper oxidase with cupredoxin domain